MAYSVQSLLELPNNYKWGVAISQIGIIWIMHAKVVVLFANAVNDIGV